MSLKELACETGFSVGYLSRIEAGEREPSWAALRSIADVWELEPIVHLVSPRGARTATVGAFRRLSPEDRLCRQSYPVFEAVMEMAATVPRAVITGAAAAVLQGVPLAVDMLEAVVPDEDESIEQLVLLLRRSFCLFRETSSAEFRLLDSATWVVRNADSVIRLESRIPPTLPIVIDGVTVNAATVVHLVHADPVVADAVGTVPDGSA